MPSPHDKRVMSVGFTLWSLAGRKQQGRGFLMNQGIWSVRKYWGAEGSSEELKSWEGEGKREWIKGRWKEKSSDDHGRWNVEEGKTRMEGSKRGSSLNKAWRKLPRPCDHMGFFHNQTQTQRYKYKNRPFLSLLPCWARLSDPASTLKLLILYKWICKDAYEPRAEWQQVPSHVLYTCGCLLLLPLCGLKKTSFGLRNLQPNKGYSCI